MSLTCIVSEIFNVKCIFFKHGLGVGQGHWKRRSLIDHVRLTFGLSW